MKAGFFTLRHDTQLKDRMSMAASTRGEEEIAKKRHKGHKRNETGTIL